MADPVATTLAPTSIGETFAVLRGTVNPMGSPTSAWFAYGTTTNYGTSTLTSACSGAIG
jgi:hypothetical protein